MKSKLALILIGLLLSACGPNVEELATLTSTAKTAIALAWTLTPTVTNTATATATLTPMPTDTPQPTATYTPTTTPTLDAWPTPTLLATRVTTDTATIVAGFNDTALSLAWSLDGDYLFIGTKEMGLTSYNVPRGELGPAVGNGARIQALAINAGGNLLAAGLVNDGSIRLISTESGMLETTIWPAHDDWPQAIVFSPNDDWMISGGDDGKVLLWDVDSGELLHTIYEGSSCSGLGLSPDGRTLVASFGFEQTFRVWDTRTWTLLNTFPGDQAQDLAISPDGKRIVTAGGGIHEANVWEVSTGNQIFNLREHPSWVWAVAYSPQGDLIASAGVGDSIYLWDARTGMPIRELYGGVDFIQALAFSPDGNWLASGGGQVIIWDVSKYSQQGTWPHQQIP